MATFTNTVTPSNAAANAFYSWTHPIAAFLSTAGWLQQADTGQIVWPASIFNITDANGNGTTVTFTGTVTNGTATLRVGSQVKVSGTTNFGTVAAPIVYTITGGNLTTTFTALSATSAHDAAIAANTGWAMVYVLPTITSVVGTGSVATYTYTDTDGILRPGQSIVIPQTGTTGFTNTGFNGTFTITAVSGGTFTVANATNSTETKTVTAQVATLPGAIAASSNAATTFPPGTSTNLYEIWKMADGNGLPVFLRINYGTNSPTTSAQLQLVMSSGTDGAGTATGGSTGTVSVMANGGGAAGSSPSYMSGSTNRLTMGLFVTLASTNTRGFFNIERSHDSSGADTTAYATLVAVNGTTGVSQSSITSTGVTTAETKVPCCVVHSTGTASFGSSTLLSPVFPIIGAVGNPMINWFVGKSADFADQTQFSFTVYNSAHNYIVCNSTSVNAAGTLTYDTTCTCCLVYRYD